MVLTTLFSPADPRQPPHGYLRPVDLQTDLAPLADLIELSFANTMDDSGRAAIREMRTMSHLGIALSWLGRLNDLALGISMGYVWLEDEQLVGNVSIYPANYPQEAGNTWIIANVAVHPHFQRRGIATHLMHAALNALQDKGARRAILQVDYDNTSAIELYLKLGFIQERPFCTWERHSMTALPARTTTALFITRRRAAEWQQEYELAQRSRNMPGGIGWLKPLHPTFFRQNWWKQLAGLLTMNSLERLIIRDEATSRLRGALWVENTLASIRTRLTLFADPDDGIDPPQSLLSHVIRRFRTSILVIEHPYDDARVTELLREYRFRPERIVWHMRRDF